MISLPHFMNYIHLRIEPLSLNLFEFTSPNRASVTAVWVRDSFTPKILHLLYETKCTHGGKCAKPQGKNPFSIALWVNRTKPERKQSTQCLTGSDLSGE